MSITLNKSSPLWFGKKCLSQILCLAISPIMVEFGQNVQLKAFLLRG
jgi:hypothetical protein